MVSKDAGFVLIQRVAAILIKKHTKHLPFISSFYVNPE
jgi:hypothetical protein